MEKLNIYPQRVLISFVQDALEEFFIKKEQIGQLSMKHAELMKLLFFYGYNYLNHFISFAKNQL